MELLRIAVLFAVTAVAEIVGCYLPWLVLRQGKPVWLLLPACPCLLKPPLLRPRLLRPRRRSNNASPASRRICKTPILPRR